MKKETIEKFENARVIELYTEEGWTVTKIAKEIGSAKTTITAYLLDNGVKVKGAKTIPSFDLDLVKELYSKGKSLTEIGKVFGVSRDTISKYLKLNNIDVVNYQNITKFNENVFDEINTEEKAYWLGFIYADGYISSSSNEFELSLAIVDLEHLNKFNEFMKHIHNNVKIGDSKCGDKVFKRCRWGVTNKHLWNVLNNYGCTPRKSLTLKFPDESIFIESDKYSKEELIRHFIRGYVDGDGCLSYQNKEHTIATLSILGTENFLNTLQQHIPEKNHKLQDNDKKSDITKVLTYNYGTAYRVASYLYSNSHIYLDRKYNKYLEYCRLYEELYRELQTNNGEGCDVNPVISTETKESVPSYRVETEPSSEE